MKTKCECGFEFKYKANDVMNAHRLLAGDATKKEDVQRLMSGRSADMVFVDSPFNVRYKGTKFDVIKNDDMPEEDFIKFSENFIARLSESTKPGGAFYICSGYSSFSIFLWALRKNGFQFSTPIIWVKNNTSLGWGDYRHKNEMIIKTKRPIKKAEPILYGWKEGAHYFIESRFEADVWEVKRRASNTMVHPTQKPLELVGRAIRNSSKRGEIVLDTFLGGCSSLISAHKEGRICYGMELDLKFVEIALARFFALTGIRGVKVED